MSPEITRSKLNVLKVVGKSFQPNTILHLQKRSFPLPVCLRCPRTLHMASDTEEEIGQWAKFDVPKMKQLRPVLI